MTHVTLTINDTIVMDGDLGQWSTEPPAISELKLKAGREPWAIPTMQAIAAAAIHQQDTTITVANDSSGWSLQVRNLS